MLESASTMQTYGVQIDATVMLVGTVFNRSCLRHYITKIGAIVIKPFHLSFVVPDLNQAREFYVKLLGCDVGRDTGEWIDIIFFGHQVTMHQERLNLKAKAIDHFGPILEKDEWLSISRKLSSSDINFELPPTVKGNGTNSESGKYVVKDPAGNLLEFKYYENFSATVEGKNEPATY